MHVLSTACMTFISCIYNNYLYFSLKVSKLLNSNNACYLLILIEPDLVFLF